MCQEYDVTFFIRKVVTQEFPSVRRNKNGVSLLYVRLTPRSDNLTTLLFSGKTNPIFNYQLQRVQGSVPSRIGCLSLDTMQNKTQIFLTGTFSLITLKRQNGLFPGFQCNNRRPRYQFSNHVNHTFRTGMRPAQQTLSDCPGNNFFRVDIVKQNMSLLIS